jgi:hypothetical protein
MRWMLALPFALAAALSCQGPPDLAALLNMTGDGTTGLVGMVRRGSVTPVCQVGVPCDAPFKSAFNVLVGGRIVAAFVSDSAGHYSVLLAPGVYAIGPDTSAPVWPRGQTRQATVGPSGMTQLDLEFDTGIR